MSDNETLFAYCSYLSNFVPAKRPLPRYPTTKQSLSRYNDHITTTRDDMLMVFDKALAELGA